MRMIFNQDLLATTRLHQLHLSALRSVQQLQQADVRFYHGSWIVPVSKSPNKHAYVCLGGAWLVQQMGIPIDNSLLALSNVYKLSTVKEILRTHKIYIGHWALALDQLRTMNIEQALRNFIEGRLTLATGYYPELEERQALAYEAMDDLLSVDTNFDLCDMSDLNGFLDLQYEVNTILLANDL